MSARENVQKVRDLLQKWSEWPCFIMVESGVERRCALVDIKAMSQAAHLLDVALNQIIILMRDDNRDE